MRSTKNSTANSVPSCTVSPHLRSSHLYQLLHLVLSPTSSHFVAVLSLGLVIFSAWQRICFDKILIAVCAVLRFSSNAQHACQPAPPSPLAVAAALLSPASSVRSAPHPICQLLHSAYCLWVFCNHISSNSNSSNCNMQQQLLLQRLQIQLSAPSSTSVPLSVI